MEKMIKIIEEDASRICNNLNLSELKDKKILITGASGLLGLYFLASLRHLCLKLNTPVTIYAVIHSLPDSLFSVFTNNDFTHVFKGDISDNEFIKSLPSADVIIHAAGYGQPGKFTSDPVKTLELNTIGTFGLLRLLNGNGKFLFTSSAEVYTGLEGLSFSEEQIGTTNTSHPRSCYIEGKRTGEAICQAFISKGVNAKSARISLTYGPGTKKGDARVLNMLIEKAMKGDIHLIDQGEAVRSFLYVSDAIEMMWNILLRGTKTIYNVGGYQQVTIFELAQKIGEIMNAQVFTSKQNIGMAGAPQNVSLNMALYNNEFKHKESITLSEGLDRTIEWQRELYSEKK